MFRMKPAVLPALLGLTVLLAACNPDNPTPSPSGCTALGAQNLASLDVSVPSAVTPATNWNAPHVPGRLLVTSTGKMSAQAITTLNTLQARQLAPGVQVVTTPASQTDETLARQLTSAGLQVQPDFLYQALSTTNDPGFPGNAGLTVDGVTTTQGYLTRIRIPEAWDAMTTCSIPLSGALTAVIDSAVEATHPELKGRVVAQVSHVTAADGTRTFVHGTASTGVIAATGNNNLGISGIGQAQSIVTEEVLTNTGATTSAVVKALSDALGRGAKVINLSIGMPTNPGDAALDNALSNAAQSAVLVAAAGNTPDNVYYPASYPAVIAVGAVGLNNSTLAWYSAHPSDSTGRALDIVAPGGAGTASKANDLLLLTPNNTYTLNAGTSFAAPQVSGVAALMRAANPNLSAPQTRALLLQKVNSSAGLPLLDAEAAVKGAITGN